MTGETTTYSYDVLGNLKSVVLPDATVIEYVVDGRNRRVGKKVNGTLERQWIYDGQLRPVAELDGTGAMVSQFVYATHINIPDYIVKGATTYRVITDHLGSLRFVIDTATGTIAQRMDYDDWGNVLVNTAPDFTPFGFAGGMYDSQTKLTRFGARDYDAEVGRWTAKDPIGFGAYQSDLYAYSLNSPCTLIDPTGKWFIPPMLLGQEPPFYVPPESLTAFDRPQPWRTPTDIYNSGVAKGTSKPSPPVVPKYCPSPPPDVFPKPGPLGEILKLLSDLIYEIMEGKPPGGPEFMAPSPTIPPMNENGSQMRYYGLWT